MISRIKSFIKEKIDFIKNYFFVSAFIQKIRTQKHGFKKNGYVAIILAFATPALVYAVKYAIDKSILSSWNIFKKQNDKVFKRCASAVAYEVASHWDPAFSLDQQIDSLQKFAAEAYNTYPEYHGGILGRAIAGLERINIFDLKSLRVTDRTSMNGKHRSIKFTEEEVKCHKHKVAFNDSVNPYYAAYKLVDIATNKENYKKRPPVAVWKYERESKLPKNILSETDIFIGPSSFPRMEEKDKNDKNGPYAASNDKADSTNEGTGGDSGTNKGTDKNAGTNEGIVNEGIVVPATVVLTPTPDTTNDFQDVKYESSGASFYSYEDTLATGENAKVTISPDGTGGITEKLLVLSNAADKNGGSEKSGTSTSGPSDATIAITLEEGNKVKIVADDTVSSSSNGTSSSSEKDKSIDTAYATLAECNVDIILSIPTNAAACNTKNQDAASANGEPAKDGYVIDSSNTEDAKKTPIYQIAQAYRYFLKENFFYTQGVNVGLIPYSAKVSISPERENWTTSFNAFYDKAFIDDISKFPRKCKPAFRSAIFYGTKGKAGLELCKLSTDGQLDPASYEWKPELNGCPIMFRMGFQACKRKYTDAPKDEKDEANKQDDEALVGDNITYGGNYIYTGSILSNENPNAAVTKPLSAVAKCTNNPDEPDTISPNKFLKMNMNPCYGGYANLLGMKCEKDCPSFLPNPYYIIELTNNVHRIYEILGALYPFYDNKNVSNFTFIPVTWANNLLQSWTKGDEEIQGTTQIASHQKKTTTGRKKVLILVVNKPDYFEPGELTYLGFNNDYAEFSGVESDKIDFAVQSGDTATGYKGILEFKKSGTIPETPKTSEPATPEPETPPTPPVNICTFSFPRKALLKITVRPKIQNEANSEVICYVKKYDETYTTMGDNTDKRTVENRETIYIESNTIRDEYTDGKYSVVVEYGSNIELISAELTNSVQPPRLEWKKGENIVHSYNGKVPFTMKVQAPEASVTFSSSAGVNDHSGKYKLPYYGDNEKTFDFKSKQSSSNNPENGRQICDKLSYNLKNTLISYTISDRKIRWVGGSKGWSDDGVTTSTSPGTSFGTGYTKIKMTDTKNYRQVPYWLLTRFEEVIEDEHGWIFKRTDKCKSYYYFKYVLNWREESYQDYIPGQITFNFPEQMTGSFHINYKDTFADKVFDNDLKYNFDGQSTVEGEGKNGLKIPDNNIIDVNTKESINIYQYDEFFSYKSKKNIEPAPTTEPKAPGITFRSRPKWYQKLFRLIFCWPFTLAKIIVLGIVKLKNEGHQASYMAKISKPPLLSLLRKPLLRSGTKIISAVFSSNASNQPERKEGLTTSGNIRFVGTANISAKVKTITDQDKLPSFSLTKKDGNPHSPCSFAEQPKIENGESMYVRTIYVNSKEYDFNQEIPNGNSFVAKVALKNGATIISVEPDYDNVDLTVDGEEQKKPDPPEQRIEWDGGNVIKTIGGQIPLKVTISPKEECQATLSRIEKETTTGEDSDFKTHSIEYGKNITFKDLIKSDNITMSNNGKKTNGAKLNKFSYILKNASMKCTVKDRKIRWKGGQNEWSDEGVSILDSACISKETSTGESSIDTTNPPPITTAKPITDADSHLVVTKRIDEDDDTYYHQRGRIVWRFPEKLKGTAKVSYKINHKFFPTVENEAINTQIATAKIEIGNIDDNNDLIVKDDGTIDGDASIKDTTGDKATIVTNDKVVKSFHGNVNIEEKYIEHYDKKMREEINSLKMNKSKIKKADIDSLIENFYFACKELETKMRALDKAFTSEAKEEDIDAKERDIDAQKNVVDQKQKDIDGLKLKYELPSVSEDASSGEADQGGINKLLINADITIDYRSKCLKFIKSFFIDVVYAVDTTDAACPKCNDTDRTHCEFCKKHSECTPCSECSKCTGIHCSICKQCPCKCCEFCHKYNECKPCPKCETCTEANCVTCKQCPCTCDNDNEKCISNCIDALREKYRDLATAESQLKAAQEKLAELENELTKTETGYYENIIRENTDTEKTTTEGQSATQEPTISENKFFQYNGTDNIDKNGELNSLTCLSNTNDEKYKSITAEKTEETDDQKKHWNADTKNTLGTFIGKLSNEPQVATINITDYMDMLAVFQSTPYLNGQRFYYMEFTADDTEASYNISVPKEAMLNGTEEDTTTKYNGKEVDEIIKYDQTNIYTRKIANQTTTSLSIVDPDRQITKVETADNNVIPVTVNDGKIMTSGGKEGILEEDYRNATYTTSGTFSFCGTGYVDVTVTGASKPYAYIEKVANVGDTAPNKFEFDSYYELGSDGKPTANIEKDSDGNDTYKVAQKSIYIDPYTYKYEKAEDGKYKVTIKLSNAVITGVEVMSDALAHPELSTHTRIVDGETGQVRPGGTDETKHENMLKVTNAFKKIGNDKLASIKDNKEQMYVLNYPGDANLSIEDQEATQKSGEESGEVDSKEPISGTLTFTGGNRTETVAATGAIRKFFPFWRDSKFSYVSASSTTSATKLIMCEFSYPMNAILLFGQQSLSLGDESFYKYKWQDPAGVGNTEDNTSTGEDSDIASGKVYDQSKALNKVTKEACAKLKEDCSKSGSDVRIYVVKYRAQQSYNSLPYDRKIAVHTHDYSALEACASSTGGKSSSANDEQELKKRLDEIAEDIKVFASYKAVQVYDIDDQELENQGGKDQGGEQSK